MKANTSRKRRRNVLGVTSLLTDIMQSQMAEKGSKYVKGAIKGKGKRKNPPRARIASVDGDNDAIQVTYKADDINEVLGVRAANTFHVYFDKNLNFLQSWSKKSGLTVDQEFKLMEDAKNRVKKSIAQGKISNPSALDDAKQLSKKWHGREPKYETEVTETETFVEDVAELADLEELGILSQDMSQYFISFKKNRPKLCATDDSNLEFIGGDQEINVNDVGIEMDGKKLVPLGFCYQIVYETDKHHLEGSNGYPESYEHFFCEEEYKEVASPDDFKNSDDWFSFLLEDGIVEDCIEKGMLPMLVYNKTDCKLLLVGGVYSVEDVGIKN